MTDRTAPTLAEILGAAVRKLAEEEPGLNLLHPNGDFHYSNIAYEVGKYYGRAYHAYKAQRLLEGKRISPERYETKAWIRTFRIDRNRQTETDTWYAAGVLDPEATHEGVRLMIDTREDTRAAQQDDGRVRGSIRPSRIHLRLPRPLRAPSTNTALPAAA